MEFVISHLAKSYGKHQVLTDVDYTFEEGKIYGLIGRNGAGKTTLFNCLNSDIETNGGRFFFKDGEKETDKIENATRAAAAYREGNPVIIRVSCMEEAVAAARANAVEGDIVSMSPASASFDLYKNFAEKGLHFKRLVNELQ